MHAEMKRPGRIAVIVAALSAIGPFSVDTYFPSFPAIAEPITNCTASGDNGKGCAALRLTKPDQMP
jgi:hypothetical protein